MIVFCRNIEWNDPIRTNTHSMAGEFQAGGWQCAWVSQVMTPWRMTYPEFAGARENWRAGGRTYNGMFEYSPLFLLNYSRVPVLRSKSVWRISPYLTVPSLHRKLSSAGFGEVEVCWIGSLTMSAIGLYLKPRIIIYQAHDAFAMYPDAPPTIRALESATIEFSDLVVTTSESTRRLLQEIYPEQKEKIQTLTHGVHFERYEGDSPEPADLRAIPRPRAALMGTLDLEDENLVTFSARSLPQVQFVLIGPGGEKIRARAREENLQNLRFLGSRPQAELPAYLKHCDVGLIAYRFDWRETRLFGTNPMKRYEYAAAGLPTVSVSLREYELTPSPLHVARSPAEFAEAIRTTLAGGAAEREALLAFARGNRWSEKYVELRDRLAIIKK